MSLYGFLMDDGHAADRGRALLALLDNPNPGRFRDAWVENQDGQPVIAIYTRNGGGNREHYHEDHNDGSCTACAGEAFENQPAFLFAADDTFDRTYRTYRFRVTATDREIRAALMHFAIAPVDTDERWRRALAAMKDPQ
jgi:hypothetical protein